MNKEPVMEIEFEGNGRCPLVIDSGMNDLKTRDGSHERTIAGESESILHDRRQGTKTQGQRIDIRHQISRMPHHTFKFSCWIVAADKGDNLLQQYCLTANLASTSHVYQMDRWGLERQEQRSAFL
jgi:hypothetical protein